jgi:hypothetical protein
MTNENLTPVRRLAVLAVIANIAVVISAALALPKELLVLLPIVGLVLPLLTIAGLEAVAQGQLADHESNQRLSPLWRTRSANG